MTAPAEAVGSGAPRPRDGRAFAEAMRRVERMGAERRGLRDRLDRRCGEPALEERAGGAPGRAAPLSTAIEPPGGAAPAPSAGSAGRAVEVGLALRRSERAQVEIAVGEELRYGLSLGPGGVEIRAEASPALERVARADLHAVADRLRRRGIPVARAALAPRAEQRLGGGRGR